MKGMVESNVVLKCQTWLRKMKTVLSKRAVKYKKKNKEFE